MPPKNTNRPYDIAWRSDPRNFRPFPTSGPPITMGELPDWYRGPSDAEVAAAEGEDFDILDELTDEEADAVVNLRMDDTGRSVDDILDVGGSRAFLRETSPSPAIRRSPRGPRSPSPPPPQSPPVPAPTNAADPPRMTAAEAQAETILCTHSAKLKYTETQLGIDAAATRFCFEGDRCDCTIALSREQVRKCWPIKGVALLRKVDANEKLKAKDRIFHISK